MSEDTLGLARSDSCCDGKIPKANLRNKEDLSGT